ncbi:MAG: hypothetical protein WD689_02035, partial [Gaiellaceae bacterium]
GVPVDALTGLAARALDALPDPAFVVDVEGHVVLRNLAHKRMLAQMGIVPARAELLVDEVAARLTDPDLFRAFVAANEQDPDAEHEQVFTFRSAPRTIVVRTCPVRAADCSLVGRVWVLREVTEERLRRVNALAEARTPLTAIQGFVELLATHEYDEPTRLAQLRLVLDQCERLAGTLDELFATD